jgi:hypothetical protein
MPGLDPGIYGGIIAFAADGRVRPGHDDCVVAKHM